MNEKEKKDFYIAMCKCCLVSQAMKRCQACLFNIGLQKRSTLMDPDFLSGIIPVEAPEGAFAEIRQAH